MKPGKTLATACSEECQKKRNDAQCDFQKTTKGKAIQKRLKTSEKGSAGIKSRTQALLEKTRTDNATKLKKYLGGCALDIWKQRCYVVRNECALLAEHTAFQTPSELFQLLTTSASAQGLASGEGWVAHFVPQHWYDFNNLDDVRRCWHPANVGVQTVLDNKYDSWLLHVDSLERVPAEAFPEAYPKATMLAAARHDNGKDLYSQKRLTA